MVLTLALIFVSQSLAKSPPGVSASSVLARYRSILATVGVVTRAKPTETQMKGSVAQTILSWPNGTLMVYDSKDGALASLRIRRALHPGNPRELGAEVLARSAKKFAILFGADSRATATASGSLRSAAGTFPQRVPIEWVSFQEPHSRYPDHGVPGVTIDVDSVTGQFVAAYPEWRVKRGPVPPGPFAGAAKALAEGIRRSGSRQNIGSVPPHVALEYVVPSGRRLVKGRWITGTFFPAVSRLAYVVYIGPNQVWLDPVTLAVLGTVTMA